MKKNKYTLSDAAAKRIVAEFKENITDLVGFGYLKALDNAIDNENLQMYNKRAKVLQWFARNGYQNYVNAVAYEMSDNLNTAKSAISKLENSCKSLLSEIQLLD